MYIYRQCPVCCEQEFVELYQKDRVPETKICEHDVEMSALKEFVIKESCNGR